MNRTTRLTIVVALTIALAPVASAAERAQIDWSPLKAVYEAVTASLEAVWESVDADLPNEEKPTDEAGPYTVPDGAGPYTVPDGVGPCTLPEG